MKSGLKGIALFIGNTESPMDYPSNGYHFRQDSNFSYFFGLDIPDMAGIIDFDEGKQILFANDVDIEDIIWMGPQPAVKDLAARVGIAETLPFAELANYLLKAKNAGRTIHFTPPYRAESKIMLNTMLGIPFGEMKTGASTDLIKAVVALRAIKEQCEIDELELAAKIGYEMHMIAFRHAKPGVIEQEICGLMEGVAYQYGKGPSFPIILSVRGETLHNHNHSNVMQAGQMLLSDAGAQSNKYYTSDYTRTMPVSGKFSEQQKMIYQIVLDANNHALSVTKPEVTYQSVHLSVCRVRTEKCRAHERQCGRGCQSRCACHVFPARTWTHDGHECARHGRPGRKSCWLRRRSQPHRSVRNRVSPHGTPPQGRSCDD
jgi:Xaa-Pro aminopeptidase